MDKAAYLLTAFALVWALVFGYVIMLFVREKGLRKEIESLKETLKVGQREQ